ncbi:MAG: orotidine-5'-phosphate decarboxylase [Bacteroidales bacterium]|nr:orotidine-5'-phosphate decarboxylase [Lentimicrobiaceae bacterium]MDD5695938.1 orotidine-5'-phosphate decarboxylase [Bacteroidales bacterium]
MTYKELTEQISRRSSFLCIGLDTDPGSIPVHLLQEDDPVFIFNKAIIDATHDLVIAYKPNLAFYESQGARGWLSFEKTVRYIRATDPGVLIIADAKRGDIGNTSRQYARAFFENLDCDAVTVAPYMGEDSITPFLSYPGKWIILLAVTSNKGANDFQFFEDAGHKKLFEQVLERSATWATKENLMFVAGATRAEMLADIRKIVPDHFLLVPGVGAQGGSLKEVVRYGMNRNCGLIVNSSRGIIYASSGKDFAPAARAAALEIQKEMSGMIPQAPSTTSVQP